MLNRLEDKRREETEEEYDKQFENEDRLHSQELERLKAKRSSKIGSIYNRERKELVKDVIRYFPEAEKKAVAAEKVNQAKALEEAYGYLEKSVDMREEKVDESVAVTFISTSYAMLQQGLIGPDVMINNYVKIMVLRFKQWLHYSVD